MRLTLIAFLALTAAAHAQEAPEQDLPRLLAERGWFDLARGQLARAADDPRLSAEQRAGGRLGLALLAAQEANRESRVARRLELTAQAQAAIAAFLNGQPTHPRRHEALDALAQLLLQKGRFLSSGPGRSADPDGRLASEAFAESRRLYQSLIDQLQRDGRAPEPLMFARLNLGLCLFAESESTPDPARRGKLLEEMTAFYETEVIWPYDGELAAVPASTLMGRAFQILAQASAGAAAETAWRRCFMYIEKGARLLDHPEWRKIDDVREIAVESAICSVRARRAYGDTRTGSHSRKAFQAAADFADSRLKLLPPPDLRRPAVLLLRVEAAHALLKAGRRVEGLERLDLLWKGARGNPSLSWLEDTVTDLRAEYTDASDARRSLEIADNLAERGPAHLPSAIRHYRNAARLPDLAAHAWMRVGDCYAQLGRWLEASTAYSFLLDHPELQRSAEAPRAALELKRVLDRIARATGAAGDRERADKFLDWALSKYPREMSATAFREQALVREEEGRASVEKGTYAGAFLRAAEIWARLADDPAGPLREEATFRACLNHFLHAFRSSTNDSYAKSVEFARRHLQLVGQLPSRDAPIVRNATGSVLYGMWACLQTSRPSDALEIGDRFEERFPTADRSLTMKILRRRVEALIALSRIEEACTQLEAMERRYEKDPLGLDALQAARADVANGLAGSDTEEMKLRGAEIMLRHLRSSTADPKPEEIGARADAFYGAATRRKGAEARRFFEHAHELYERLLITRGTRMSDVEAQAIRDRMLDCLIRTGRFDQALKELELIPIQDPELRRGRAWEMLADARAGKAETLPPGGERNNLLATASEVYRKLLLRLNEGVGEPYWRVMWKYADVLFKTDPDQLARFFDDMGRRNIGPAWDEGDFGFKEKFEDLRSKNDARMPTRRKP